MALTKKISQLTAKGSNLAGTDLVPIAEVDATSPSGYTTKYVTGAEISSGGVNTLYNADDTIVGVRTASIGQSLAFHGGKLDRTNVNGRNIVEVTRASDLPSTLVADTTYVIRGSITFTSLRNVTNDGCEIIGLDRNTDEMVWSGTGSFLRVVDVDFNLEGLKFSATNSASTILRATNVTGTGFNDGRDKVLTIQNCQFRGTYDVMQVSGFDLVDVSQTLFFYIKAVTNGCSFEDVSKLQISSCEFIRWFDESTLPTPSGYATAPMIKLEANNLSSFGAVNISGCIIHPQQTQNGIDIDPSSTTGFGTISSNTFVNTGLTTGEVFAPVQSGLPDYSQTATYNYDIYTNQGILNSTAGILMTMVGNTTATTISTINTPVQIDTGNNNAQTERVRWSGSSNGQATYLGTKTIYVSIHSTIAFEKSGGGTDTYTFYIYKNGVQLSSSQVETDATSNTGTLTMSYATLIEATDFLTWYVENNSGTSNITIKNWQIVIRE
jgi:hypothetical protein